MRTIERPAQVRVAGEPKVAPEPKAGLGPEQTLEPKLLACDLDGTLLDPRGAIRPAVLAAIRAVRAAGVEVVVATGRSPWDAAPAAKALGLDGPQIVMNGGALMWPDGRHLVYARRLDFELVVDAIAFAQAAGIVPLLGFTDRHVCESARDMAPDVPDFALGPRLRVVERLREMAGEQPVRVYLPTRPDEHGQVLAEAHSWFGERASIVYGDCHGVEVMRPGTNKGSALRRLAEALGLGPEQVAAMGDGPNDREMLEYAGRRAVLRQSDEQTVGVDCLSEGHLIVSSSASDGAVEALARFFPSLGVEEVAAAAVRYDDFELDSGVDSFAFDFDDPATDGTAA